MGHFVGKGDRQYFVENGRVYSAPGGIELDLDPVTMLPLDFVSDAPSPALLGKVAPAAPDPAAEEEPEEKDSVSLKRRRKRGRK